MVSRSNSQSDKSGLVGSSDGYQRFTQCSYSLVSGGHGLLVPSDQAVIFSAKPLRNTVFVSGISSGILRRIKLNWYVIIIYIIYIINIIIYYIYCIYHVA